MIKKLIKKIVPLKVWEAYRKFKVSRFKGKRPEDVFTEIYKTNYWKSSESVSGQGSELTQTKTLIDALTSLIKDKEIKSILDVPCGDFNWMRHVEMNGAKYVGADIVQDIVEQNKAQYADIPNVNFTMLNLINDHLPTSDLVFVRDCLVHLSYQDIFKSIENIRKSGSKYLFTTTYPNYQNNYDIITGDWRPLNLMAHPFNFPDPLMILNENCTEGKGEFADKSMVLWDISKL